MSSLLRSAFRRLLAPCFFLALCGGFIVALLPAPDGIDLADGRDKIMHFVVFAGFAVLGLAAWPRSAKRIIVALFVYGLAIELAQALVPYRSGDLLDWCANAIGVLTVAVPWMLWQRLNVRSCAALRPNPKP